MTIAPILQARQLSCERGERQLFGDLSFELVAGELLQIQGANGSGKTSLLRIICGLLRPDRGEVYWQGEPVAENRGEYLRQVHYSGHLTGIKLELTPRENLHFAAAMHGGQVYLDVDEALERVELYGFENEPARMLSAGQRRRIGLASLLVTQGKLWILDEPFTALDSYGTAILEQLIEAHLHAGGVAVMASHSAHSLDSSLIKELRLLA